MYGEMKVDDRYVFEAEKARRLRTATASPPLPFQKNKIPGATTRAMSP